MTKEETQPEKVPQASTSAQDKRSELTGADRLHDQAQDDSDSAPEKSFVRPNAGRNRRNRPRREFEDDARVRVMVSDGRYTLVKTFLVAEWRWQEAGSTYQYRLKDELTGAIAQGGRWFNEDELDYD